MDRRFLLLYGSQTGQSEAVAEEIFEKAYEHGFRPDLHSLSMTEKKFNVEKENLLVLVISSTGDGEPPDSALKFWRRIRKKTLPNNHLSKLRYTILGLGDSNYSNFCQNPQNFDARFKELGARHFYPTGFADDAIGLEIVVEPWIDGLMDALKLQFSENIETCSGDAQISPLPDQINEIRDEVDSAKIDIKTQQPNITSKVVSNEEQTGEAKTVDSNNTAGDMVSSLLKSVPPIEGQIVIPALPHPFLELEFCEDESIDLNSLSLQNGAEFPSATTGVIMATLVASTTLTRQDAVKTALDVQLEIPESTMTYEPGDSFGIVCKNNDEEVENIIQRLAVSDVADCVCYLKLLEGTKKKNAAVPKFLATRTTIRHMLSTCCDIRTPLKKGFIHMLAEYTTESSEKARLQELCSKQGASQYTSFIREPSLSLLDILLAFPSCCPPIARVIEQLPRLLPRPYSASSSPLVSRNHLHFVFNIVEIPSTCGRQYGRKGVCTGWLSELSSHQLQDGEPKPKIAIYARKNLRFRLPSDPSVPIILIGAGTGVAPFIGFLQHREAEMQASKDFVCGPIWLFFGCRHKERDYLYRSELERLNSTGILSKLLVAFSRDNQDAVDKTKSPRYVQDNIRLHSAEVCNLLLEKNAVLYVCGDARNMSKDVNAMFSNIISQHLSISEKEADSMMMKLRQEGRYLEDIWT
ncbi:methionine synthase reductase-like [Anneissia japonica]|uniref:methionine synthase reductase-like n=1 Tax=Anneissia japonica TaxID=1529436 RepID=UPI0014259BF2|nr:methionine synthase reductase-like [Anneissia japonica]XP_033096482.1 methionine synthase reductase-like [Anneissia japonica]